MYRVEDGSMPGPGLSIFETVLTFVVIPSIMFVVISVLAYAMTGTRKEKKKSSASVITHIE